MTQTQESKIKCPVCDSICAETPLYKYTATEAAAHFCPATRNADRNHRLELSIKKLWENGECSILRCDNCEFSFGFPFVGGGEEFYSILHEQRGYPQWKWEYDYAVREAFPSSSSGNILDIGAGDGAFLRGLSKNWNRHAVEGSETTRKSLEALGIRVFHDLSTATHETAGTFQIITIFQVLEHISDFKTILSQCHKLLSKNGQLIISVPDGEAMIRQEKLTGCPDMPPNHVSKWTLNSLTIALTNANFNVTKSFFEPSSWNCLKSAVYMIVMADAKNTKSLSAQIQKIKNKKIRSILLSIIGFPVLIKMLPHLHQLRRGGAFLVISTADK